jgi:hypothetical protein
LDSSSGTLPHTIQSDPLWRCRAIGKFGAIVVQAIFKGVGVTQALTPISRFAILLYALAATMLVGAASACVLVPEVQILSSEIEGDREDIFVNRERRARPPFGRYQNLVLERIEDELEGDLRINDGIELAEVAAAAD